jgi:hypothetical protein
MLSSSVSSAGTSYTPPHLRHDQPPHWLHGEVPPCRVVLPMKVLQRSAEVAVVLSAVGPCDLWRQYMRVGTGVLYSSTLTSHSSCSALVKNCLKSSNFSSFLLPHSGG